MALDKVLIGERVRKIREELLGESRSSFAKRCNLTERHVGQIERGEFLISLPTLDNIASATGVDADFILYGKGNNNKLKMKETLATLIDRADKDELQMYYRCITIIKTYVTKKEKN
ncbi:MAG: helix-turn-helix domain-containing protein [Clostridia bacterium]